MVKKWSQFASSNSGGEIITVGEVSILDDITEWSRLLLWQREKYYISSSAEVKSSEEHREISILTDLCLSQRWRWVAVIWVRLHIAVLWYHCRQRWQVQYSSSTQRLSAVAKIVKIVPPWPADDRESGSKWGSFILCFQTSQFLPRFLPRAQEEELKIFAYPDEPFLFYLFLSCSSF